MGLACRGCSLWPLSLAPAVPGHMMQTKYRSCPSNAFFLSFNLSTMLKRIPLLHQPWRRVPHIPSCTSSAQFRPSLSNSFTAHNRSSLRARSYASISAAELQFGQPLHETHPHLLEPGECKWDIQSLRFLCLVSVYALVWLGFQADSAGSNARNHRSRIRPSSLETCQSIT